MQTKCIICKKRYAEQQDWKTGHEKELCLTCYVIENAITSTLIALWQYAKGKGIDFQFTTKLTSIKK